MTFLEDARIGERIETGRHTFGAAEIKAFAVQFDPQPFHVDDAAASSSFYGRLIASGWHTAAVCMRFIVAHRVKLEADARARGETVARTGVSPGFRDLKWPKPVYVGDTITYAIEALAIRPLGSQPGMGLLTSRNTGTNQAGDLVLSFDSSVFVERRSR